MTTPAELIRASACGPRCLLAATTAKRCTCQCQGHHHGLLLHVHLDALIDARRAGIHHLSDVEIVASSYLEMS